MTANKTALALMLTPADWEYLADTAALHHLVYARGRVELFAEIRLRVAKFGATPEDRARLRIEVLDVGDYPSATTTGTSASTTDSNVSSIAERRRRLTEQPAPQRRDSE